MIPKASQAAQDLANALQENVAEAMPSISRRADELMEIISNAIDRAKETRH